MNVSTGNSLHICYVESGYPHPHGGGGAGTYVQLVGRELVRRGYDVTVLAGWCPDCPAVSDDVGVTVYRPRFKRPLHWYISKMPLLSLGALALRYLEGGWKQYRFLEGIHNRRPIDIVEFTEGGDFWHAWRAPFPYLVHLHGSRYTFLKMSGRPVGHGDWYHRRLELLFVRRAAYVVSPSQALLDIVTEEAGTPFEKTRIIPYPLDPTLLEVHENNDSNQSEKRVLFAARNDPVKGADILLRAAPLVREAVPDATFELYGFEPNGRAMPAGVQYQSFVPKQELLRQYRSADVCVVPSRWDNSPNTMYEAMAAGIPVVASRVGGIPEIIVDGETGLLVEPGNERALAEAITTLLTNESRRSNMGRRSLHRITKLANLHDNIAERLALYTDIIKTG